MVILKSIGNKGEDRFLGDENFPHMDHKVSFRDLNMENEVSKVIEAKRAAEALKDHEFFITIYEYNKDEHLTVYGTKESLKALLDSLPFESDINPRFDQDTQEKEESERRSDTSETSENAKESKLKSESKSDQQKFIYICQECNKSFQSTDLLQKDVSGEYVCPEDGTILDKYKKMS